MQIGVCLSLARHVVTAQPVIFATNDADMQWRPWHLIVSDIHVCIVVFTIPIARWSRRTASLPPAPNHDRRLIKTMTASARADPARLPLARHRAALTARVPLPCTPSSSATQPASPSPDPMTARLLRGLSSHAGKRSKAKVGSDSRWRQHRVAQGGTQAGWRQAETRTPVGRFARRHTAPPRHRAPCDLLSSS